MARNLISPSWLTPWSRKLLFTPLATVTTNIRYNDRVRWKHAILLAIQTLRITHFNKTIRIVIKYSGMHDSYSPFVQWFSILFAELGNRYAVTLLSIRLLCRIVYEILYKQGIWSHPCPIACMLPIWNAESIPIGYFTFHTHCTLVSQWTLLPSKQT